MAEGNHEGDAVVLLSGGLDSATVMAMALADGYRLHALTLSYGQLHGREVDAAKAIAARLGAAQHLVIDLPLARLADSALTGGSGEVRDVPSGDDVPADIPETYVPGRNIVFLSLALSWAESLGAEVIYIGANAVDYSGYPDCRPEFIEAFNRMAKEGTRAGLTGAPVRVSAPLLHMSKDEIIAAAVGLGAPLELTWSCYRGGERPCGTCDSCRLRSLGFAKAGVEDPAMAGGDGAEEG